MKVTAILLVAFMLLTFWGVFAQVNAEAAGLSATVAVDRFFDSYLIWILGFVPLPAFKGLAVLSCIHLVCSMIYRMPRGIKNLGLYGIHGALLVLLAGSLVGSEVKREYNGYALVPAGTAELTDLSRVTFYGVDDSLGVAPVKGEAFMDRWDYRVNYKGEVDMTAEKKIALYSASYDPFHFVPYAFMAIFLFSAFFHYLVKVHGTRRKNPEVLRLLPVVALLIAALPASSRADEPPAMMWLARAPDAPVLVDSVVRPFDSFARGFLDDLNGRVTYKCKEGDGCQGKLPATFVVEMMEHYPENAKRLKLFKVLRSDVSEILHLPVAERYVSFEELSQAGSLMELYASRKDEHPTTNEIRRLYGNYRYYGAVVQGTAYGVVPKNTKVDTARLKAEVFYHKANFALCAFIFAALACLMASLNSLFKSRKLDVAANVACMGAAAVLSVAFALRFYVASRPPMSSLYEIVLLVALLLVVFESGAFLLCRKRTFALMVPVTLMAVFLLFLAKFILEPGDTFVPIPAILNSSVFLTLHVFTIALGFAGMILSGVVAHLVLFRGKTALPSAENPKGSPLYKLLYGTLVFGAMLTMVGTLLGGVWADFAWGRFWGFDPKECGALFVILWAMLSLHLRGGRIVTPRGFALLNGFNVIVTFLCWFGINLLGVGLHSYGFQSGSVLWLAAFVAVDTAVIVALRKMKN